MTPEKTIPDHWLTPPLTRMVLAVNGVLVGICTLFIASMLTLAPGQLDAPLHTALAAFALALPPSASSFLLALREHILSAMVAYTLTILAAIAVVVGIGSVVTHLDKQAALWQTYCILACVVITWLTIMATWPRPPARRTPTAARGPEDPA
jgi:uncharacterized membrane protein YfcA